MTTFPNSISGRSASSAAKPGSTSRPVRNLTRVYDVVPQSGQRSGGERDADRHLLFSSLGSRRLRAEAEPRQDARAGHSGPTPSIASARPGGCRAAYMLRRRQGDRWRHRPGRWWVVPAAGTEHRGSRAGRVQQSEDRLRSRSVSRSVGLQFNDDLNTQFIPTPRWPRPDTTGRPSGLPGYTVGRSLRCPRHSAAIFRRSWGPRTCSTPDYFVQTNPSTSGHRASSTSAFACAWLDGKRSHPPVTPSRQRVHCGQLSRARLARTLLTPEV